MFVGALIIGLREGLEAALIIGILLAYVRKRGRRDLVRTIWSGAGVAVAASVALGALFTYGLGELPFHGEEIIAGVLSLVAVGTVTWMVFWMVKAGRGIKGELESQASAGIVSGKEQALFWIALVAVGREGIETMVLLWGWALQPVALGGAVVGILIAAALGYLIFAGLVRVDLAVFFRWTGAFLVVIAAGILAYAVHELQEAALLPGPYSGLPIAPTDAATGAVYVGLFGGPFWLASFPFGYAFDLRSVLDPQGLAVALLRGSIGFAPRMAWLEVIAWVTYLAIVLPKFIRAAFPGKKSKPEVTKDAPEPTATTDGNHDAEVDQDAEALAASAK